MSASSDALERELRARDAAGDLNAPAPVQAAPAPATKKDPQEVIDQRLIDAGGGKAVLGHTSRILGNTLKDTSLIFHAIPQMISAFADPGKLVGDFLGLRNKGEAPKTGKQKLLEAVNPVSFVKNMTKPLGLDLSKPVEFKPLEGGAAQMVKDLDPRKFESHPLLYAINVASFVDPALSGAKATVVNGITRTAAQSFVKESVAAGIEKDVISSVLKDRGVMAATGEAFKTGNTRLVAEIVSKKLGLSGVDDGVAAAVASKLSEGLAAGLAEKSTVLRTLKFMQHPIAGTAGAVFGEEAPLRRVIFGTPEKTAVSKIYGADVVAKNPEGFLKIEQWAEAQVKELGIKNTVENRYRVQKEWIEQDPTYASLSPEQRITHFEQYAEQQAKLRKISEMTGIDLVATRALDENTVSAMRETIDTAPPGSSPETLLEILRENFGSDMAKNEETLKLALKNSTPENAAATLAAAVTKLGDARSVVSFEKFSPEVRALAKEIEGTGYRAGRAPRTKPVSYADQIGKDSALTTEALKDTRKSPARILDAVGLSSRGSIQGADNYVFQQGFTDLANAKFGSGRIRVKGFTNASIPVDRLYEWLDNNKQKIQQANGGITRFRTVYDMKANNLVKIGFDKETAAAIEQIAAKARRDIPASIIGAGEKIVNFMRAQDNPLSKAFDGFLNTAYKLHYNLSPTFALQEFAETTVTNAFLLKDPALALRAVPDVFSQVAKRIMPPLQGLFERIARRPTIEEVTMVNDTILKPISEVMQDYQNNAKLSMEETVTKGVGGLKGAARTENAIVSNNVWYRATGQSAARMATAFNRAIAEKFFKQVEGGASPLEQALEMTAEGKLRNPELVQAMRQATEEAFHYKQGFLTSPLIKTLNLVWFPMRFQAKTVQLGAKWLESLHPATRSVILGDLAQFANWSGTPEGKQWRKTNENTLYHFITWATAHEQIGTSLDAAFKGRLFQGNTGKIGGLPLGWLVGAMRTLTGAPSDPDQFDRNGVPYTKTVPIKNTPETVFKTFAEEMLLTMLPSFALNIPSFGLIKHNLTREVVDPLLKMDAEHGFMEVPLDSKR